MENRLLMDSKDIDFIKGRANQLIPPQKEKAMCDCMSSGLIVNVYLRKPSPEEINALLPGQPAEVALYEYKGIVMLLLNFGDILLTECPIHILSGNLPDKQPKTPGISMVLTDLESNIIQGVRFLSLRPSFWKELYTLLHRLNQLKYTVTKQKLLEELAMEIPDNKWEKAVIKHKII